MRWPVAIALMLTTAPAAAEPVGPAKIRLPGGSIIFGVVTEMEAGSHVVVMLPHGELRTIPWAGVDLVHVRGYAAIGPGAPPPSSISWADKTAPASVPPDPDVHMAKPPPTGIWALGARGTVMATTSARSPYGLGLGGEANLVHWFAPELALYGMFEHVRFQHSIGARTTMLGAGLRVSSSAGTSALFDLSTGYRVLDLEGDRRPWLRRGAIPLRLGAGIRIRSAGVSDVDLLVHVAPHLHGYSSMSPPCAAACEGRSPSPIGFVGVSMGLSLGL